MTLTLRAVTLNDHPLTQPITAHFDAQGGSIGRSDHNTLALPDPERHISRQHAEISVSGDGYVIKNVGSANPIIVRGQALARGDSAPLLHRDHIRIGGYLLEVIHENTDNAEASTIARGRAAVDARTPVDTRRASASQGGGMAARPPPSGSGGLGDLGAPLSRNNPFAKLLGDPVPAPGGFMQPAHPGGSAQAAPGGSVPSAASGSVPSAASAAAAPRAGGFNAPPPSVQSAAQPAAPAAPTPAARQPANPSSDLDPFFDLQPPAAGVSASSPAWASAPAAPVRQLLPDDFDPFAPKTVIPAPRAPAPPSGGTFDDLIPSAAPASIDQMFDLQPGARDPLADFMADLSPGASSPNRDADAQSPVGHLSTDPLALFGGSSQIEAAGSGGPSASDNVPELRSAYVPPAVAREPAREPSREVPRQEVPRQEVPRQETPRPETPQREVPRDSIRQPVATPPQSPRPAQSPQAAPAAQAAGNRWAGDPRELWSAFCEGAGISFDPPQGINPELMRVIGGLMRSAVTGTLQLMMVRATTKHELRAEVTIIQARNNNPLKFSPDARSALEQMLQPPMRGFLAGPAAMTDAMQDLVGHTIGTMAGTRAALEGVLDRFTPQELEAKLTGKSMLDSLLPMNRKAKLWELYLHHFDTIRNEAHDDFHTLFGRAFLAAYEQQLDRLQRDEPDNKS